MSPDLFIILTAIGVGFIVIGFYINQRLTNLQEASKTDTSLLEWLKTTQNSLEVTNRAIHEALRGNTVDLQKTLDVNTQSMNKRLDSAAQYISSLSKNLGEMSEIGRSMKDLQDFLKSPKLRGNIGEEVLHDLISQMFPKNSFHLQYSFKSGDKVDAALKTDAGILPIDSKFPLENFRKLLTSTSESDQQQIRKIFVTDVRKHIRDIASKYIRPDEGTMDFAVMYIPSEPVYYEVVNLPELIDYARQSRVYVVSPSTLYALLQTILVSFEGKKIETQAREIFRLLRSIQSDYLKTSEHLTVLGRHVNNAFTKMNEVNQSYNLLGQKLTQTQMIEDNKKIASSSAPTDAGHLP